MFGHAVLVALLCLAASAAQAMTISAQTLTNFTIPYETLQPNGTTIQFTIDVPCSVVATISDTSGNPVATISQSYTTVPPNAQTMFWNAYWLINGQGGRRDGSYSISLTATDPATLNTDTQQINGNVSITSIDIHNVNIVPTLDSQGNAGAPFTISYQLAKAGQVTAVVLNSSNTVVRTLLSNKLQVDETISTSTIVWNGLTDGGAPVPIGLYTLRLNAVDPATGDHAFTVNRSIAVTTLAGAATDPVTAFTNGVFVFPNPIRGGQATFQFTAVRDGADVRLKIFTLTGDLVRDQDFPNLPAGTVTQYLWDATNQAGRKLGRGLYYYEMREEDPLGTLQTIKKFAVIQ